MNEPSLALPYDFAPTASLDSTLARHAFSLPALGTTQASPDVACAALFAAQLARYSGQDAIPLAITGAETAALVFHITDSTTLLDLFAAITTAPKRSAPTQHRAAFTWFDRVPLSTTLSTDADLHLLCAPGEAAFVYNSRRFLPSTIARFADHYLRLFGALSTLADVPLARLPLLTASEHSWLAQMSRGAKQVFSRELLHQVVAHHAATTPDAVAVRFLDRSLTYAALDAQANRLAHALLSRGVTKGARVAVCLEPALDISVALLGIWKAGAVYVPLEPTYPAARITAILEDVTPAIVISQRALADRLALSTDNLLTFDGDAPHLAAESSAAPAIVLDDRHPAYVYYTSGTTGTPKGVQATHANLRHYIRVAQARYAISSRDTMPAIARFSFSISMFELLAPLVAGGTSLILPREEVLDVKRLARALGHVTFFHAGPSLLRNLLAHIDRDVPDLSRYAGVRHASSGGDLIAPEILESLKRIFVNAEVFVIYGSSEIACMGCTYPVARDRVITKTFVGKPFDNMRVRVLDRARNTVPVGVIGEIHFAGDGVVPGYLNRAALSAEKFIDIGGERFYRTGDLGRVSDEGFVEILGRDDFQIKVRGMRLELADVEHHLRRSPGVKEGVVVARDTPTGDKVLAAFVVLDSAHNGSASDRRADIRRHLVEQLPDYMVPAHIVVLDALPLNHNLKVDRRALPSLDASEVTGVTDVTDVTDALATPTEARLAAIWKELLRAPRIGRDDNFFEHGGDSLLVVEFIVTVERELGVTIEGMEVLRESLRVLAALCDARAGRASLERDDPSARLAKIPRVESFYFGADASLFGVLYHASSPTPDDARTAVLLCAPIGQELVRASFVLTQLSRALAARGVPSLLFHYFGLGDSLGTTRDATCRRWQRDIARAALELRTRTQANRLVAIGARLGATLLDEAYRRGEIPVERVILWDAIDSGEAYYAEQARMHRDYVSAMRPLRFGRAPAPLDGAEELLGTTFSRAALWELRALQIPRGESPARARLDTAAECQWSNLARLEDVVPDANLSARLIALVST